MGIVENGSSLCEPHVMISSLLSYRQEQDEDVQEKISKNWIED